MSGARRIRVLVVDDSAALTLLAALPVTRVYHGDLLTKLLVGAGAAGEDGAGGRAGSERGVHPTRASETSAIFRAEWNATAACPSPLRSQSSGGAGRAMRRRGEKLSSGNSTSCAGSR